MSIHARKRRMTDICTVWEQTSTSTYGVTYSNPRFISCNFYNGDATPRNSQGAEYMPNGQFRFFGDPSIKIDDRVMRGTIQEAEPPKDAYTVKEIRTKTALRGPQSFTIYVK